MFENIKKIDIVGSAEDPKNHIFMLEASGEMVRSAEIEGLKAGEEVKILHSTDFHLNRINKRDEEENNPVVASTRIYREAFRDERTVPNAKRTVEFFPLFDETIITGDNLDYLTWGSLELLNECIWDINPNAIVALGGQSFGDSSRQRKIGILWRASRETSRRH